MKISIVTVSFNQARYLAEAMDSVLGQGYPELEYIVVDPGSTDGSRELIAARAGGLASTVLERDRGAADGLNKGFARATGEVFGFLNADDMLYPGALQTVAAYFARYPEIDIAFGNGHVIDEAGKRVRHVRAMNFGVAHCLYGGAMWLQQATFFRAETFRRSPGFNPENRTSWDGELFVQMAHAGARAGYIGADLAGFRIYASSISGSGALNAQYARDRRRLFEEVKGRPWAKSDAVLGWLYRGSGYLKRLVYRTGGAR